MKVKTGRADRSPLKTLIDVIDHDAGVSGALVTSPRYWGKPKIRVAGCKGLVLPRSASEAISGKHIVGQSFRNLDYSKNGNLLLLSFVMIIFVAATAATAHILLKIGMNEVGEINSESIKTPGN